MNKNELITLHKSFWNRNNERPLVARMPARKWLPKPYPLSNNRIAFDSQKINHNDIDVDRLIGTERPLPVLLDGDMLNSVGPVYPCAWLEAVAGCGIYVSQYSCTARPVVRNIDDALDTIAVEKMLQSPYLDVMDEILEKSQQYAGSELAVHQLHLRGVIDVLAAYMGESELCRAVIDCPERVEELVGRVVELIITVAKRSFEKRSPWNDGYVSCWRVFAPGKLLDYQIDASSLFSPKSYEKVFLKYDRVVLKEFPYSVTHIHSVGLHILDVLLQLDEVKTIELSIDREAVEFDKDKILSACGKIQEKKKGLIINGALTEAEFSELTHKLNPAGLAIDYWNPG